MAFQEGRLVAEKAFRQPQDAAAGHSPEGMERQDALWLLYQAAFTVPCGYTCGYGGEALKLADQEEARRNRTASKRPAASRVSPLLAA